MRELYSTKAVFDQVLRQAQTSQAGHIKQVTLALGELSELDQTAIRDHWRALTKDTLLERAKLHFRLITAEVQCMSCFKKYHPENRTIHCPHCGSFGAKILTGEEFHVESIEADDE